MTKQLIFSIKGDSIFSMESIEKSALILHGAGNNSSGNWFPWLKNELVNKGYEVWCPDLPKSSEPDQKSWLEVILSNKDWKFGEKSVIIGHSAGATLILRILERLSPPIKIRTAILVAGVVELGSRPEFFKYKQSLVKEQFNWKKIKKSCANFYFIHSNNDPYGCGQNQGEIMYNHLGGSLIIKRGEGHFNLEKGQEYLRFPLLLDYL